MDFSHRRKRKIEDYSFSFIHFLLPPLIKLSSHLVRSSRIQFQIKPQFHQDSSSTFYRFIPVTFPTVLPSVLFLLQTPFSFARLSVASSQQGTKSSKVLAVERFVIRSRVPSFYIYHRSFSFRFSCILHLEPTVFFLSRLFTISFFLTSHYYYLLCHQDRTPSLLFSHKSSHFCFSIFPCFLFISSAEFLFSFLLNFCVCSLTFIIN